MSRVGCVHMLRSDAEPDQPSGDACQERTSREEPDGQWRRKPVRGAKHALDDAILNEELCALRHSRRPVTPILHPAQILSREPTRA